MSVNTDTEGAVQAVPYVTVKMPRIRGLNKFDAFERLTNMRAAFARGLPEVTSLIGYEQGFPAVVIGGGPSIDGQLETIRALAKQHARILCIERMYDWCWAHDLRPEYVVTMDASEDVLDSFQHLHPGSTHLVASQCRPEVFDALARLDTYLYTTPQTGIDMEEFTDYYEDLTVINAGGSVTLCAMDLAMLLGMREIHLFGFDCHLTSGTYANGITGAGGTHEIVRARVGGRRFLTTKPFLCFAQQFFELRQIAKELHECDSIKIYGDSLVTAMSVEPIGASL